MTVSVGRRVFTLYCQAVFGNRDPEDPGAWCRETFRAVVDDTPDAYHEAVRQAVAAGWTAHDLERVLFCPRSHRVL